MSARGADSPFRAIHADAWAEPADVESLNRAASEAIRTRIEEVRSASEREGAPLHSSCLLLLGPAGAGKTHLFTRLRRQAGRRAVFIHTRPQIGVDPTPRFVLASLLDSLRQPILGEEQLQLDLVAGALLAAHDGAARRYPLMVVDDARRLPDDARRALVERVVDQVERRFPGVAPEYLEHLLTVPFATRQDRRALLCWLSGREPAELELARLGLPGPLADLDVMRALATLGVAAAYGAPLVLVFDQLENLAEDDGKTGRIQAHARLVSDLRDAVHGLVIVQMALDAEWMTRVHPALHASSRDRLEETVLHLALPTRDERRALVERWRDALPDEERARPFPHPFRPAEVDAWLCTPGMTPRMLMQACGEAYLRRGEAVEGEVPGAPEEPALPPDERLLGTWTDGIASARAEIDEASSQGRGVLAERLASGLCAVLQLLRIDVALVAGKTGPTLRVRRPGDALAIVVAQHGHPRSLGAALRAARDLAEAERVTVVREHAFAIRPTWKAVGRDLAAFTAAPGARFVSLDREDLARLLALEAFVTAARSQDLSGADGRPVPTAAALEWAARALDCASWPGVLLLLAPAEAPAARREGEGEREGPGAAASARGDRGEPVDADALDRVRAALAELRVASVERLVREVQKRAPGASRAGVVAALRKGGARFFGESVVALERPWP
ncbi:MAG: AAA family ATPase [Myxococcales bacterium]|nr:AAA family ATPase [Myxococcales bacterium]